MPSTRSGESMGYRARKQGGLRCALAAFVLGLGAAQAYAQCMAEQKLTTGLGDLFGGSVSVSGDTALVGARGDCRAGSFGDCGSAFVFRFNGTAWVEGQKLTPSDVSEFSLFGSAVSISEDVAVVGADADDCADGDDCGSVYVFRFNGTSWVEEQKLTASDAAERIRFGTSVSVSGNAALVMAHGAAYVFRFNGTSWDQEQKLTASDGGLGGSFGESVSLVGDTALVGAPFGDCAGQVSSCGAAYVFRFNGVSWVAEQKLTASDAGAGDRFGASVFLNGDTALVGAIWDDCAAGGNCGAAYVFRFDGTIWVEQQKLTASDAGGIDFFGSSVSVSGNTALVGAEGSDCAPGAFCGAAYVFRFNGGAWVQQQKLTASPAVQTASFGTSVSLSGETAFVGAPLDPCATGRFCGSVSVFSCPAVVNLDIKPGKCPNPVNPRSKGVVPVAIVGTLDFDVTTIDQDSLTLARADGVGEAVSPLSDRHGPRVAIKDVASPFDGELCTCPRGETDECGQSDGHAAGESDADSDHDDADAESDDGEAEDDERVECEPIGGDRHDDISDDDGDDEESDEDEGDDCGLVRDGIDDLSLKFSACEMSRAFDLRPLPPGETIELVLRGTLQDGTTFEARDCIVISGARRVSRGLRGTRRRK